MRRVYQGRCLMTIKFGSVTFFPAVMPAHLYVDMITMTNVFLSSALHPIWDLDHITGLNQERFCDRQRNGSTRGHPRSFVFLPLRNGLDFWVHVNFKKKKRYFVAYNKIQNLTIKKIIKRHSLRRKNANQIWYTFFFASLFFFSFLCFNKRKDILKFKKYNGE